VVAGRSQTRAGGPHAVSGQPMLIHTCHVMPMPRCAVALISHFQNGMVVAWHGRGMTCVNQTRPHCVNQMGKTQSKPLTAGYGMGTAGYVWISLKRRRRFWTAVRWVDRCKKTPVSYVIWRELSFHRPFPLGNIRHKYYQQWQEQKQTSQSAMYVFPLYFLHSAMRNWTVCLYLKTHSHLP
jgi:hypothetical protein